MHRYATMGVDHHLLVDLIDATFEGLHKSATPDDGIEFHWQMSLLQFGEQHLFAERLLFKHIVKL